MDNQDPWTRGHVEYRCDEEVTRSGESWLSGAHQQNHRGHGPVECEDLHPLRWYLVLENEVKIVTV